jgi:DNA-binding NarL/FixJ family response regulator
MTEEAIIKIAMADDHILLRHALALQINGFDKCRVILEASSGTELIEKIRLGILPDIVLLDVNMPDMDGYTTARWLHQHVPQIHVLILTMYQSELSMIRLLQDGVKGFLKKSISMDEFKFAIKSVMENGFYYSNSTTSRLVNLFRKTGKGDNNLEKAMLSDVEVSFLKNACSDLTYKQIAVEMNLNPRTIDTIRDQLFIKLDVKSRVGLALVAIKNGVVTF